MVLLWLMAGALAQELTAEEVAVVRTLAEAVRPEHEPPAVAPPPIAAEDRDACMREAEARMESGQPGLHECTLRFLVTGAELDRLLAARQRFERVEALEREVAVQCTRPRAASCRAAREQLAAATAPAPPAPPATSPR